MAPQRKIIPPKICKNCGEKFHPHDGEGQYKFNRRKYCTQSCSSSLNNKGRGPARADTIKPEVIEAARMAYLRGDVMERIGPIFGVRSDQSTRHWLKTLGIMTDEAMAARKAAIKARVDGIHAEAAANRRAAKDRGIGAFTRALPRTAFRGYELRFK